MIFHDFLWVSRAAGCAMFAEALNSTIPGDHQGSPRPATHQAGDDASTEAIAHGAQTFGG